MDIFASIDGKAIEPHLDYEVWALREPDPVRVYPRSELVASFCFFNEALDYLEYATQRGVPATCRSLSTRYFTSRPRRD